MEFSRNYVYCILQMFQRLHCKYIQRMPECQRINVVSFMWDTWKNCKPYYIFSMCFTEGNYINRLPFCCHSAACICSVRLFQGLLLFWTPEYTAHQIASFSVFKRLACTYKIFLLIYEARRVYFRLRWAWHVNCEI